MVIDPQALPLAWPAVVLVVVASAGQEQHMAMAAND